MLGWLRIKNWSGVVLLYDMIQKAEASKLMALAVQGLNQKPQTINHRFRRE
jgi:hypothetical protein